MFRNKTIPVWTVALGLIILSSVAFAGVGDYDGTWEGDGTGDIPWGPYQHIVPLYDWIMYVDGTDIEGSWEDGALYGSIEGSVNTNGYAGGTWDMDYPNLNPKLHGTWTAVFDENGTMEGDWWYYNILGQKLYGGTMAGYRSSSGIPE